MEGQKSIQLGTMYQVYTNGIKQKHKYRRGDLCGFYSEALREAPEVTHEMSHQSKL